MKINPIIIATVLVVVISLTCMLSDKLSKKYSDNVEDTKEIEIELDKSFNELNKIEYDDFDKQFMTIPDNLKRKLDNYEAMNYHSDRPMEVDVSVCTQKELDEAKRCENNQLKPSFQTMPDVPDGVFMAGQKPVCHIDRVRAIEDFSCPVKQWDNKIEDPCDKLCRHCVVGECSHGICN